MTSDLSRREYNHPSVFVRPGSTNQSSWMFNSPGHWSKQRLKYLGTLNPPRSTLPPHSLDGPVSFVPMERSAAYDARLRPETRRASQVVNGYTAFTNEDLLIAKITPCFENGKGGIAAGLEQGVGYGSTEFHVFRPSTRVDVRFVYYATLCKPFRDVGAAQMTGSAGQQRVPVDFFANFELPIPQLDEQRAIADYLDAMAVKIHRFIRNRRRLIEVLNEQKQAIINRAVTRGLDPNARLKPSGIDWLGEIPEHWEVWRIGHFARVGNGSTPSRGNAAYWQDGDSPWLNSSAVNRGIIEEADQFVTTLALRECHLPIVEPGSLLVAITGQGKTRGTAAILSIRATINQHLAYITPHNRKLTVLPEYLNAFFAAAYPELRRMSDDSGSTKGALTCSDLRHFQVAIPPEQEQKAIVARINIDTRAIEATLRTTLREIELIGEYRTRLIADVVTGKVDVRGLAPAESPIDDELLDEGFDDEEMLADDESELVGEAAAED